MDLTLFINNQSVIRLYLELCEHKKSSPGFPGLPNIALFAFL